MVVMLLEYVSDKLKNEEWGSKVVSQLSEYIRSKRPDIKGFSKRNLYNMVMFYDEYSSETFAATIRKYMTDKFVQSETAQIGLEQENAIIVQSGTAQFVQSQTGQMPNILTLTTLTNHIEILCRCKSVEERLFYILYAHKEQLLVRELQRCISNQTYSALLSDKTNLSKGFFIPTSVKLLQAIMLDNNSTVKNQIKNKNHLLVEGFNDKTYLLQACLLS